MRSIPASELILNPDGSVYHLKLHPEEIANTVITVGDPDRVQMVSKYFDKIEIQRQKREFVTNTGVLNGQRLTVISTGIGMGNVDIVLNELDALVNIDLNSRQVKADLTSLNIIRIGTSGALHAHIPIDTCLISRYAIGLDSLLHFYERQLVNDQEMHDLEKAFLKHLLDGQAGLEDVVYSTAGAESLIRRFHALPDALEGITATCGGFYGAQDRHLRLKPKLPGFLDRLALFQWQGKRMTNLEMETAGLYGLSRLLGHQCCSLSLLIANRETREFSRDPEKGLDLLIRQVLELLTSSDTSSYV